MSGCPWLRSAVTQHCVLQLPGKSPCQRHFAKARCISLANWSITWHSMSEEWNITHNTLLAHFQIRFCRMKKGEFYVLGSFFFFNYHRQDSHSYDKYHKCQCMVTFEEELTRPNVLLNKKANKAQKCWLTLYPLPQTIVCFKHIAFPLYLIWSKGRIGTPPLDIDFW